MAAAIGQNPFNLTAAGELGAHRETMLNNELLLRVSLDFQFIIRTTVHTCTVYQCGHN